MIYLMIYKNTKKNIKNTKNSSNIIKNNELINLSKIYKQYNNDIKKDIKLLDNIINKYGENEKKIVYRGISNSNYKKGKLYKSFINAIKKKGNIVNIPILHLIFICFYWFSW